MPEPIAETMHTVIVAWAHQKRHLVVDGVVLCRPQFSDRIRPRGATGYNALSLHGIIDHPKRPDSPGYHQAGSIPFLPLGDVERLILSSICAKCQRRYARPIKDASAK
jgi:hypothetical protein